MVFASENTRQWVKAVFMSVLLGAANMAMAAGGLNNVQSNLKDWYQSFYGILGILAMFALAGTAAWGYLRLDFLYGRQRGDCQSGLGLG